MKRIAKKTLPVMLLAGVLAMSGALASCGSSQRTMYERQQSNKSQKVKSNIKVRGTNKANSHTTRSY